MRNSELRSSGQVAIIQKQRFRINLYVLTSMQGTVLTVPITYRLAVASRNSQDFPYTLKINVINISKLVQQTFLNNTHYYKFGAQLPLITHSELYLYISSVIVPSKFRRRLSPEFFKNLRKIHLICKAYRIGNVLYRDVLVNQQNLCL